MPDCINYQIISTLITQLKTITAANLYEIDVKDVFIPKKILKIETTQYPCILVYYNQTEQKEEGFEYSNADLDVILVYTDGLDDNELDESYIVRYRNVEADIKKCIMCNPTLDGLCEYVNIIESQPALFMDGDLILEAHVSYLKINRNVNQFNPY